MITPPRNIAPAFARIGEMAQSVAARASTAVHNTSARISEAASVGRNASDASSATSSGAALIASGGAHAATTPAVDASRGARLTRVAVFDHKEGLEWTRLRDELQRFDDVEVLRIDLTQPHAVIEQGGRKMLQGPAGEVMEIPDAGIMYHGAVLDDAGIARQQALEAAGMASINDSASMLKSRDKWETAESFRTYPQDINHPPTYLVARGDEYAGSIDKPADKHAVETAVDAALADMGHKPGDLAWLKFTQGTEGIGAMPFTERYSMVPTAQAFAANGQPLVVQGNIAGARESIRAFGVRRPDGSVDVMASMLRKPAGSADAAGGALKDLRDNVSNGGTASPVAISEAARQQVIRGMNALGLDVGGGDLMGDAMETLVEINSGPGLKIEGITGKNVVAPIAELAAHRGREVRASRMV